MRWAAIVKSSAVGAEQPSMTRHGAPRKPVHVTIDKKLVMGQ